MLEGETNGADDNAHARVKQQAESSRMGENRGVVGGGFLPGSDDPISTSNETDLLPDENNVTRSN